MSPSIESPFAIDADGLFCLGVYPRIIGRSGHFDPAAENVLVFIEFHYLTEVVELPYKMGIEAGIQDGCKGNVFSLRVEYSCL